MLSASVIPAEAQPGYITTVAGGGTGGDGGAAVAAALLQPGAVAVDAAGNLYIADTDAQRVRKVNSSTGIITTVAGNGSAGSGGDGGAATAATLNYPVGVAVDSGGNLYITEFFGQRVRRVSSATGVISTYAGNGTQAFGGDGGAATAASLDSPWGVSVDPVGNLYIADSGNNRIRKVTAATGVISTIAGSSSGFSGDGGLATAATLAEPTDVSVGGDGNFYIVDFGNNRIRKIIASSGIISTVAGDGSAAFGGDGAQATSAQINQPYGVAADPAGNIYIADSYNHRIRYVAAATGVISTIAGTGTALFGGDGGLAINASFELPLDVAISGGSDLLIADYGNARVRRLTGRELPVITWATPSSIVYGTALSATQLNATANVTGTLVYNPAAGTVLNAGVQTLSVAFTPTDEVTYSPVSKTVTIDVTKVTPVITWANPAPISSSTPLSSTQLNATASVAGTFVYTPPAGITLSVGNGQTLSTVFTPTNTVNYATANKQVTIDVTSGLPTGPPYTLTITPPAGGRVGADAGDPGDGELGVHVHGLVGRLQRDGGVDFGQFAGSSDVRGDVYAGGRHDLRADDCAGADGRDGDGERAVVRGGRRDVRGDARERDDGGADGGAGGGLHVHELGRGVQRDQCRGLRADGCGEELQRDVHGERGRRRAADGAAVYADDHAADGRAGDGGGD
ncbi:MAG: hypothetical protein MUE61_08065 [Vicinamibacterales bacterium]|nr:hypothetical protein [Vicinamibacterales bacterium]